MPLPVPFWLESPTIEYSTIQVTLEPQRADAQGRIGYVLCTAKHSCFETAILSYDIYAVNYGYQDSDTSSFKRQILLGQTLGEESLEGYSKNRLCIKRTHQHRGGLQQYSPPRSMWCMNCWHDDIYHSGIGGVPVPFWLVGRYFTRDGFFTVVHSCSHCLKPFQLQGETRQDQPTLFLAVLNAKLQTAVEAQLGALGIQTTTAFERRLEDKLKGELRNELIATVLHPDRVERLAKDAGLEPWDWVDAMG